MPHPHLVSVIMPVYNHARYAVEAITSVLAQDWRPLELIIIDDGSQDESAEVIRSHLAVTPLPDGVTVTFSSRANQGAHATINEGLQKARGTYLAILNSDDAYMPGRISRCITTAENHRARMVFTYVDPVDDEGASLSDEHPWRGWYADVMMQELDLSPGLSTLLLQYNIGISTGNFVFHRSLLNDVGLFHDFRYAHDVDYLLRVALNDEPVLLREKLYRYRIHSSNTISENRGGIEEEYAEIVRRYLETTLSRQPGNPLAPRLDDSAFSLASISWVPHLSHAIDSLMAAPALTQAAEGDSAPGFALHAAPSPAERRGHVTLVSHELSRTGAPVLLRDVASALHQGGISTNVISLRSGPLAGDFAAMKSPAIEESRLVQVLNRASGYLSQIAHDPRMPSPFSRGLRFAAKASAGISRRLRIFACRGAVQGTLLINSFAAWPLALPLLERTRKTAYWYIHETYEPRLIMRSGRHLAQLRRLFGDGKVKMLFGSDATRAKWASEGFDGEVLYWSGLSSQRQGSLEKLAPGRRMILSVQATGPRKGTRSLIEAFACGRRNGLIPLDVELRIVGAHPPSRNALSRDLLVRVNQPDLRGSVSLVPSLPPAALEAHYAQASVYVQSSTMECLPLALLTAMAHGLPIVSTDADGCREAIIDGETGRLVPSRQITLLAEAMGQMLADPSYGSKLGMAARAMFDAKFSLEATAAPLIGRIRGTSSLSA
jgi:glycosyltransferase involved in cell wall biosynthesis